MNIRGESNFCSFCHRISYEYLYQPYNATKYRTQNMLLPIKMLLLQFQTTTTCHLSDMHIFPSGNVNAKNIMTNKTRIYLVWMILWGVSLKETKRFSEPRNHFPGYQLTKQQGCRFQLNHLEMSRNSPLHRANIVECARPSQSSPCNMPMPSGEYSEANFYQVKRGNYKNVPQSVVTCCGNTRHVLTV